MNYPSINLAALLVIVPSIAFASSTPTTIFKNAADVGNVTLTTGANATITVVDGLTTPVSTLDGDALQVSDTNGSFLPTINHDSGVGVLDALKISFDVNNFSTASANSNIVFRMGPTAGGVGAIGGVTLGVQLTTTGTVAAESVPNANFTNAYVPAERFNVTIFFNESDSALNLSAYDGPVSLGAKRWALYINGELTVGERVERNSLDLSESFGFSWRSGTGGGANLMNFQLDNMEYTNISVIPEPASFGALFGLGALGFVSLRRRRAATA